MGNDIKDKVRRKRMERFVSELKLIPISRYAFDKIHNYSLLLKQITGRELECGGYLVSPKDTKDIIKIVYDATYMFDQDVSLARGWGSLEGLKRTISEAEEKEHTLLGFWHSHGALAVFPSNVDKEAADFLISYDSKNIEYDAGEHPFELKEDDSKTKILVPSVGNPYEFLEIGIPSTKLAKESVEVRLKKMDRVRYWYLLIVNNKEDRPYYGEIRYKIWKPSEMSFGQIERREKVNLEFLDIEKPKKDLSSLLDEVYEGTRLDQKKLSDYVEFKRRYALLKNMLSQDKAINLQTLILAEARALELRTEQDSAQKADGDEQQLSPSPQQGTEASKAEPPIADLKIILPADQQTAVNEAEPKTGAPAGQTPANTLEERMPLPAEVYPLLIDIPGTPKINPFAKEYEELEQLIAGVKKINSGSLTKEDVGLIKLTKPKLDYYKEKDYLNNPEILSRAGQLGQLVRRKLLSIEKQIESDYELLRQRLDRINQLTEKYRPSWLSAFRIKLRGMDFVNLINMNYTSITTLSEKYPLYESISIDISKNKLLMTQVINKIQAEIDKEKKEILACISRHGYEVLGETITGKKRDRDSLIQIVAYLKVIGLADDAKEFERRWRI